MYIIFYIQLKIYKLYIIYPLQRYFTLTWWGACVSWWPWELCWPCWRRRRCIIYYTWRILYILYILYVMCKMAILYKTQHEMGGWLRLTNCEGKDVDGTDRSLFPTFGWRNWVKWVETSVSKAELRTKSWARNVPNTRQPAAAIGPLGLYLR
jgi:hypothetical protein